MFTSLLSIAQFDKNLLNVFVLKTLHPECKTMNKLHGLSKYSKATFGEAYKQLEKFNKSKKINPSVGNDKTLLEKLESLARVDKALPTFFLYFKENPKKHQYSTYVLAEECKVSHNRVHTLMTHLSTDGSIYINGCERSYFDIDFIYGEKIESDNISSKTITNESETTAHNIEEINKNLEELGDSFINDKETEDQIIEMKGLIKCVEKNRDDLDRNSLHTLIKYINNIYINIIKYISNIKVFKGKSDSIEPISLFPSNAVENESIPQNEFDGDPDWTESILKSISSFPSKFLKKEVIIQHEEPMKEDVLYVCNSWNSFASMEGSNLKKIRVSKKYAKKGIFSEGDNLLTAISLWIEDNPDDWKEMWDELIEYSKKNQFMKGNYKNGDWKPSLSWIFRIHKERGRNLNKILEGGYDFANDKPKIGDMKHIEKAAENNDGGPVFVLPDLNKMIQEAKAKQGKL